MGGRTPFVAGYLILHTVVISPFSSFASLLFFSFFVHDHFFRATTAAVVCPEMEVIFSERN